MKITCLCVTERREGIFGIAAASYAVQTHLDRTLLIALPTFYDPGGYIGAAERTCGSGAFSWTCSIQKTVQARIDAGCLYAFEHGADLVAIWDDDDHKPPGWLSMAADDYAGCDIEHPYLFASRQGWFVNLRTLRGEFHQLDHFWGSSLVFNEAAWRTAGGFSSGPWPGQDRAFVNALLEVQLNTTRSIVDLGKDLLGHVAFSHGNNVQTYLRGPGEPMESRFEKVLPAAVYSAIMNAREYIVGKKVFPPQPGGYDE